MAQQRLERANALVGRDRDAEVLGEGRGAADLAPTRPTRSRCPAGPGPGASGRRRPASCWPPRRRPGPASPPVPRPTRTSRTSPAAATRVVGLVHVPRAVDLRRPAAVDELVGDVGQRGVLDHRRGVQHAAHRKPGCGRGRHQPLRRSRLGDVAALHPDVGAGGADALDGLLRFGAGRRPWQLSTIRPQPAAAISRGEEQPEAAQAAGDDVGAVRSEDPAPAPAAPRPRCGPSRGTSSTTLPVCSAPPISRTAAAASLDRVVRGVRHRQRAVGGALVHRGEQIAGPSPDGCGVISARSTAYNERLRRNGNSPSRVSP